ncbi:hypothetical protein [Nonomuraea diastatica]|uniref:hypothetical protein n=1 Tax=Nonomuraea diastatica TaxID=1848329 RepID=UPI00140E13A5|nr:hypothetical protein [Nonomuraea diastatica]
MMERIRLRISDKRVLALVKAFLKAGVMHHGLFKDSLTGAPQGAILSPLPADIALTALDEHFSNQWHTLMGTDYQRTKRRRAGQGNWRLVRYSTTSSSWCSGQLTGSPRPNVKAGSARSKDSRSAWLAPRRRSASSIGATGSTRPWTLASPPRAVIGEPHEGGLPHGPQPSHRGWYPLRRHEMISGEAGREPDAFLEP